VRQSSMKTTSLALETTPLQPHDKDDPANKGLHAGTPIFRRVNGAMFLAGFASFSLIYCVQPLLPEFPSEFGVNAATASLALSLTTAALAFSILLSGAFSQAISRRGLMLVSMSLAAICNILAACTQNWTLLLFARAIEGFVLGGVPAIAMAYLAEEINPKSLGKAMGLYVGGTAFGAMVGRVGMGLVSAFTSWQMAMMLLGGACLLAAGGFYLLLPPSVHFKPSRTPFRTHLRLWGQHLGNPTLLKYFFLGAMLTSVFTTVFNYCTFRLVAAPYDLSRTAVSMIFLTFGLGVVASSYGGSLVDRYGRRAMLLTGFAMAFLGIGLTLLANLAVIVVGIALITIGFFIGHSAASSGVGANSGAAKSHGSSLYLLSYYGGASITGWIGGWFWIHGGWTAVAGLTGACALAGFLVSATMGMPKPR
jgi:MFS transporter, YNFM family, putative membrane transport protein